MRAVSRMLAAVEAGVPVVEYTPAEVKRAIVGYGRAEKPQVQQMIKLLLGLDRVPSPHDAADALAVAICHLHAGKELDPAKAGPDNRPKDGQVGPGFSLACLDRPPGAPTSRSGRHDRVPARARARETSQSRHRRCRRRGLRRRRAAVDVLRRRRTRRRDRCCACTRTCARISSRSSASRRRSS